MDKENLAQEEKQIMTFLDEEGNKVEFEAIARIFLEEQEYLLLAPADDEESEDVYVFSERGVDVRGHARRLADHAARPLFRGDRKSVV